MIEIPEFLIRAILGGIGVAIISGPLGAFMVWRRMSYFGDTLSHSGLLGVTLALFFHINIIAGVVLVSVLLALILVGLQKQQVVSSDTLLGILSHTMLAAGIISLSLLENHQINILAYLYGDILTINWNDVMWIYLSVGIVLFFLCILWRPLLLATIHPELAQVEGIKINAVYLAYILLLASVIAIAMKVVGILLITAMLIIPAATARRLAPTPEILVVIASFLGCCGVIIGLSASFLVDIPAGPAIVVTLTLFFVCSLGSRKQYI